MNLRRFVFLTLAFFALLEIFLRFYQIEALSYFRSLKVIHQYNPNYFVGLKPNTRVYIKHYTGKWEGEFSINSLGLRNLEEADPNLKKILCLGDSLVMGFGVSDKETFCYLLNEKFKQHGYQFLNAGVDGLGSWGYYQRLKELLERVNQIDTVLLFVSPNDFTMPEVFLQRGILPDDVVEKKRLEDPQKKFFDTAQFVLTDWFYSFYVIKLTVKQMLLKFAIIKAELQIELEKTKNSTFINYIKESFLLPNKPVECIPKEEKKKIYKTLGSSYNAPQKILFSKPQQCPEEVPSSILKECRDFPKEIPDLPEFTKKAYQNILELSLKHHFRLIVVILPMQIEEIYCNNINQYHPLRMYALQAKQYFEKNQIEVWDLMENTKTLCKQNEYGITDHFIPEDGHLTKLGNVWVSENLYNYLVKYLGDR